MGEIPGEKQENLTSKENLTPKENLIPEDRLTPEEKEILKLEKEIEELEKKAKEAKERVADTIYSKGLLKEMQLKYQEALIEYEKALKLDPENKEYENKVNSIKIKISIERGKII